MLEIRNVSKIYRSKTGEEVKALDNVSISFPETGMVFILGKSGSGKSTLLNVMGGLDSYDGGEFIIKGKSSNDFVGSDFDAYRNTFIGFIFQEYNVLDDFTVGANIGLALELQGKKATDEAVNGILAQVDLLNYAKRKPNELSGGQKQRVAIARALVKDPEIIMADEPTGALDSNTGKQIFDTLKELSKSKLVLIVSHDRDFAERYADRIVELADGKIIEDVTKHERKAEQISEGVHRINDNILRIESGYTLTAKDLEMINEYLAQNKGDVLLSGDGRVNEELRSAAGISKDGATTVFEGTDPTKDIKTKAYEKGQAKFIRSRLPMKNAVKMGTSGLKHKKFRLFMTVLLSFIAFAMFGLSSSLAAYEKISAATNSIIDSEIRSAAMTLGVRRTTTWDDGDVYTTHDGHALNDDDIAWLKSQTGLNFVPVFTGQSSAESWNKDNGGFNISGMMSNYSSNIVYTGKIAGMVSIGRDQLPSDYALVGDFPTKAGQIVITEFMYRQFNQYGFTDGTTSIAAGSVTMNGDKSANDIIGKKLSINQIGWNTLGESSAFKFEIVGVINTNFNYDRYANLLPMDSTQLQHQQQSGVEQETSLMDMFLQQEVEYERDFGFHALGFVVQDDIDKMTAYMANNGYVGDGNNDFNQHMSINGKNLGFYIYKKPAVEGDNPKQINGWTSVSKATAFSKVSDVTWITATPKTELAENEILLPISSAYRFLEGKLISELDTTAFDTAFATTYPALAAKQQEYKAHSNSINAALNAFCEAPENTSKDRAQCKIELYGNEAMQNALLALFGMECPSNMSAEGAIYLTEMFDGYTSITFDRVEYAVKRMIVANLVVENNYHKKENVNSEFVTWYLNRDKSNSIQLSTWENNYTDETRLSNIVSNTYWYVGDNTRFEITASELDVLLFEAYMNVTSTTPADLETQFAQFLYQLEEIEHTTDGESRTPYKEWTDLKVVGFFAMDNNDGSYMVISDRIYNEYTSWKETHEEDLKVEMDMPTYTEDRAEHKGGIWAFVVAPISASDTDAIQKLVELSYSDPDTTDLLFEMQNAVMYTLGSFNEIIETLAQVFIWVGLGLALFSSFMLMNFISTSISYKKREIGILRAVGARSSDVFKIFFSEAFVIAFINFLLATAASLTTVIILNNYMRSSGINITLLSFGPLQVLLMLGVSVFVAALASFLPVWKIARKKPVDAIKDR